MSTDNHETRGRPKRSEVDRFQTMAWFNSISAVLNNDKPTALERLIQPENFKNINGKQEVSGAWIKYKTGEMSPKDGDLRSGKPGAVVAAESFVPVSASVFRHPIWEVMRTPKMDIREVAQLIQLRLRPSIAGCYIDLSIEQARRREYSLFDSIGELIWIDRGVYPDALDHLSVQLMFLRLGVFQYSEIHRLKIADNISKTLGPVAESPWIGPFHENMFDWLEKNLWGDVFVNFEPTEDDCLTGWRRTRSEWLLVTERQDE